MCAEITLEQTIDFMFYNSEPTETGCPEEMSPEVPPFSEAPKPKDPVKNIQVTDFESGDYVEKVTDPLGEVYVSVPTDPEVC